MASPAPSRWRLAEPFPNARHLLMKALSQKVRLRLSKEDPETPQARAAAAACLLPFFPAFPLRDLPTPYSPRLHLLRHPGIPAPPARTAPGARREEGKLRTRAWQKDCRGCTTSKRRRKRNYFAQRNLILRVLRRCRFCCCHLIRVRRFEHRSGEDPGSGGLREGDTGGAPHSGALLTSISLPPSFILNPLEKGP
uniref:Uncharacterized protein n=1 Tax=Rangifer tarandus platyrhynchus TaxID=3082113 RepID=A0ACB0EUY6_RANTA|nr:unnamed protein product [Rangifer tarandus platyrhynchus]